MRRAIYPLSNTPSRCDAQVKKRNHRAKFTFTFTLKLRKTYRDETGLVNRQVLFGILKGTPADLNDIILGSVLPRGNSQTFYLKTFHVLFNHSQFTTHNRYYITFQLIQRC
jgi:hypothetical protein